MTSIKDHWCTTLINTTSDNKTMVMNFLGSVAKGRASKGDCLPNCKSVWYKTTRIGHDKRNGRYGLYVNINKEVILTSNHLSIEPMTLLTRIGGIIGVGKEFLWIIITTSSSLMMFRKRIGGLLKVFKKLF